ncbi:MAG TPA: hypothetical protein VLQ89_03955, partial [Candidatus Binatia bacterium]|nr:hypothetical protein [Candidatus Binatia bacterium]
MAVGLMIESSWLLVLFKVAAVLLGVGLLIIGHRLPRLTGGLFWMLASLGIAISGLAKTSYLLAFLAAFFLFYCMLWLQDRLPRLAMALAGLLPLPLLWFSYIYFSGSFSFRPLVALLGAMVGAVAGALWPRTMVALLAPLTGISLLAWASPFALTFPILAVTGLIACALQFVDLYRRHRQGRFNPPERRSAAAILRDWRHWTAAVTGLWLVLVLFVPAASALDTVHGRRMAFLKAPALEFSPARIFYLSGRARPLA